MYQKFKKNKYKKNHPINQEKEKMVHHKLWQKNLINLIYKKNNKKNNPISKKNGKQKEQREQHKINQLVIPINQDKENLIDVY